MEVKGSAIIVGGQRCGTTYLLNLLEQHPDVITAKPHFPEPKFFIKHPNKGVDEYINQYFDKDAIRDKTIVEKSTSYYEHKKALERIKEVLPNSRILFLVRDPLDRAISNYYFSVKNGLESRSMRMAFKDAVATPESKNNISVNPFDYIERSRFSKHINTLKSIFSKERLHILSFDRLSKDPQGYIQSIFKDILEVDNVAVNTAVDKNSGKELSRVSDEARKILSEKLGEESHFLQKNNYL